MILGVISLLVAAGLSLVVAGMSIAILVLKKRIAPRFGTFSALPVDMDREENAKKWIDRLLWVTAILSLVITLTNIGVAIMRLTGKA